MVDDRLSGTVRLVLYIQARFDRQRLQLQYGKKDTGVNLQLPPTAG